MFPRVLGSERFTSDLLQWQCVGSCQTTRKTWPHLTLVRKPEGSVHSGAWIEMDVGTHFLRLMILIPYFKF